MLRWIVLGTTWMGLGACASGVTPEDEPADATAGTGGGRTSTTSNTGGGPGVVTCGDGTAEGEEQCDGTDTRQVSCTSLGFVGGEVQCAADCTLDIGGCYDSLCGNGTIEMGEDCDGIELGGNDCVSAGFSGGTLACDDACRFTGCSDVFEEDFESGTIPSGWGTTGSGAWGVTTSQPQEGTYAAQSAAIGNSQSVGMTVELTFDTAGSISFYHRESSESTFDHLQFYVDGGLQNEWSGSNGWAPATFSVAPGVHTFEWRYEKDGSLSSGSDTVWVDQITATNGYL